MPHPPHAIPDPDQPAAALIEGGLQLGMPLSSHTVARLVVYLHELMRWNAKVNLTGLSSEREIISKHFLDSLAACRFIVPGPGLLTPGPGLRVLDVGTGAGFPGLVLKLQEPTLAVTLLEPSQKKAAFLHHMVGLLGVTGVVVLVRRLEELTGTGHEGCYDLVTTRAVRPELVLAAAPRLLAPGGRVLLFKANPMDVPPPGYHFVRQESFTLPFTGDPRTLVLLKPLATIRSA